MKLEFRSIVAMSGEAGAIFMANREAGDRPILLLGATGFVGRHLYPALRVAGHAVRCASRSVERARQEHPDREWVHVDVGDPETLPAALAGCRAAYFLVHEMSQGEGYAEREARSAAAFREAARDAGLERIIYLGGLAPAGRPSRHLQSRLETGRILRVGPVPALELRAAMIIGAQSTSWLIVRDLARRLPVMVLPRWLRNRSQPVGIADVVIALTAALDVLPARSRWYDVPGPETISHRDLLARARADMGRWRPFMVDVPVVTPWLSHHWIALVTRADTHVSRELVEGLTSDIVAVSDGIWDDLRAYERTPLDTAIRDALADEASDVVPSVATEERIVRAVRRLRAGQPS